MKMELRSIDNPLNECAWAQSRHALLRGFLMDEIWKPIPGHQGYEISNMGKVRTNNPRNRNSKNCDYRNVVVSTLRNGYKRFQCWNDGKCKNILLHRALLMAFIGPCPIGYEACHNNGIMNDNRLENLRWDTKSNNAKDVVKHGKHVFLRPGFGRIAAIKRHHGAEAARWVAEQNKGRE